MRKVGKAKAQAAVLRPRYRMRIEPDKRDSQKLREWERELDWWEEELEYDRTEEADNAKGN